MRYEGYIDGSNDAGITGWVWDSSAPERAVEVEIYDGTTLVATVKADRYRRDLAEAGKGAGRHSFEYRMPPPDVARNALSARVAGEASALPRSFQPDWRRSLQHTTEYGLPRLAWTFTEPPPEREQEDLQLAERLLQAFHCALADSPPKHRPPDLWTEIAELYHQEFVELLQTRNASALSKYLRELYARPVTHGMAQGAVATEALRHPETALTVAAVTQDYLTSLAEALGILPAECPEQNGQWGTNLFTNAEDLADRISAHLGIAICRPDVAGGLFGLRTAQGVISRRGICAIYAARRIRELMADLSVPQPAICEIGGGLGGVALCSHLLGLTNYTIVDLPVVNVLQGYYLIRSLPQANIRLYGESDAQGMPALRVLPSWRFAGDSPRYDLVFNQDSFPEMHPDIALDYLRTAGRIARVGLLSINQEAQASQGTGQMQTVVADIARRAGGYRRVYRFPHWIRRGYVEEYYAFASSTLRVR